MITIIQKEVVLKAIVKTKSRTDIVQKTLTCTTVKIYVELPKLS